MLIYSRLQWPVGCDKGKEEDVLSYLSSRCKQYDYMLSIISKIAKSIKPLSTYLPEYL